MVAVPEGFCDTAATLGSGSICVLIEKYTGLFGKYCVVAIGAAAGVWRSGVGFSAVF